MTYQQTPVRRLVVLVALMLACSQPARAAELPYLLRLADRAAAWQTRLPEMEASAARAADGVIAGGNLYAYASQGGFTSEACGRAGGLMMTRSYKLDQPLTANDTVLAVFRPGEDEKLDALLTRAGQVGAQIVLLGEGAPPPGEYEAAVFTWPTPEGVDGLRTASMSNVVGLWAWTGQFIAACVERGKMPCVYLSYGLPGGRYRAEFLRQRDAARFHAQSDVRLNDAKQLAGHYLRTIEAALRDAWTQNQDQINRAAALLQAQHRAGLSVAIHSQGHLFPAEFDQPQQPAWLVPVKQLDPNAKIGAAVVLEYQATPWKLIEQLSQASTPIVLTCSQPALSEFTHDDAHIYLDPRWPVTDAVVDLPGYDVPLLPASGVMDAAIYWQLVELATANANP